jgi:hypothetical protein
MIIPAIDLRVIILDVAIVFFWPFAGGSMSDSPWQKLYQAALAENDSRKLSYRIEAARRSIYDRLNEIGDGETRERQQLDSALHALFTLAARKRSA